MSVDWRLAKDIFDHAFDLSRASREALLAERCARAPGLLDEVNALLSAHDDIGSFLEPTAAAKKPAPLPERIGPYRVLRELGRGGMGVVYLGKRNDGNFRRRVAIKLIHPGLGADIVQRFRAERQILATLDHPHIARLLDGGSSEDGRPYLVVEYVEGETIDRYCDRRCLTIPERLELFRTVCSAVHFAHQNLVLHRDIKPGNLLVSTDGVPKLLDFGIAKLLDSEDRARLTATQRGERPMTPEYASPEQVRGETLTTGADVYALGVLLYRLLTGRRPYQLRCPSQSELEDAICRQEVERPSMAARRADREVARLRGVDGPRRLAHRLAGDLDIIVGCALRKEPHRRYRSAELLSDDVQRYLQGLPLMVREDSWRYRFHKLVARNPTTTAAIGLVSLITACLIAALAVQHRQLVVQRERAESALQRSERVKEFMVDLFHLVDPLRTQPERIMARREILDAGVFRLETEAEIEPEIRASLMVAIGLSYRNLGLFQEAEPLLEEALALRELLYGQGHPAVAESLAELSLLWHGKGRYGAAESFAQRALAIRRTLHNDDHPDLAYSLTNLALVQLARLKIFAAKALLEEALAMRRRLADGRDHPAVAESLTNLSLAYLPRGELTRGRALLEQALAMNRRLHGATHPEVARSLHSLGWVLDALGHYAEAEGLFRQAVAMHRRLYPGDHPDLAKSTHQLAKALQSQGAYDRAERLFREVLGMNERLHEDPVHPDVAGSMNSLGLVLRDLDRQGAAVPFFRQALQINRLSLRKGHPSIAVTQTHLGGALASLGRYEDAEELLRDAASIHRETTNGETLAATSTWCALAEVLTAIGEVAEAETVARKTLDSLETVVPSNHWRIGVAKSVLGGALTGLGRHEEAEPLLLEGLETVVAGRGEQSQAARDARRRVGGFHAARLRHQEEVPEAPSFQGS